MALIIAPGCSLVSLLKISLDRLAFLAKQEIRTKIRALKLLPN